MFSCSERAQSNIEARPKTPFRSVKATKVSLHPILRGRWDKQFPRSASDSRAIAPSDASC